MNILNFISSSKNISSLVLFIFIQIPSLRILYKVSQEKAYFIAPLYLILSLFYYKILLFSNNKLIDRVLNSFYLTFLILIVLVIANYYLYPIVDARKLMMLGSDQDDAVIEVAKKMFDGLSPYSAETYKNPGASTGPGLVLLLSPFVYFKSYFLVTPFFIAILQYFLFRITKNIRATNLYLLLLISSAFFWELMTNGSDLLAFGVLCILPILIWKNRLSNKDKILLILFIAMVLTSRIIFFYLAPIYGILFAERKFLNWFKYTSLILVFTFLIHLSFYLIDPDRYTPILLLYKGLKLLNINRVLFIFILFAIILYQSLKINLILKKGIFLFWVWITLPMLLVIIFSIDYNKNILNQYPYIYLGPQLPIYLSYYVISFCNKKVIVVSNS